MQAGFERETFVGPAEKADICIVIPAHNETVGLKDGNLQSNLFALSQQRFPEGVKVKVRIIAHNCSADDRTRQLAFDASPKIDVVTYVTPLRGYSYPLQLAGALLDEQETKYVAVVDADTVVDRNWTAHMHQAISEDPHIGTVAAPRDYLTRSGAEVPYGRIKTSGELIAYWIFKLQNKVKPPVKLVYGSSLYQAKVFRAMAKQHLGEIMPEGVVEDLIRKLEMKVAFAPHARSISDGEKFAHKSPLRLLRLVTEKARVAYLGKQKTADHLLFILEDLTRYFPEFGARLAKYQVDYDKLKSGALLPGEQRKLLEELKQELAAFNAEGKKQMQQDLERIGPRM